ncbi:MAG: alkene reductase [Bacteroidales bacterium]|jgi:N-ethylmaleimide reductase|nr:alkene reductase [Bacteroidales bacterium]
MPKPLLEPFRIGDLLLPNRFVMAPLTRQRAYKGLVTNELHAEYYSQRATAGLIISEASQISPKGQGYPNTPGIYSKEQIEGWKLVTDAVHAKGGRIFCQMWHVGRHSHPLLQLDGGLPVGPSAVAETGHVTTPEGKKDPVIPHALTKAEIELTINDYRKAARNAIEAGFDGVEIHAANGYLIEQFLNDSSNLRTDEFGGSIANKALFGLQVTAAVVAEIGAERTGIRLSPSGTNFGVRNNNPVETYEYFIEQLNDFNLAYIHLIEPFPHTIEGLDQYLKSPTHHFRPLIKTSLITSAGYNFETAEAAVVEGFADLVAFGKDFISNPDLVLRYANNERLNAYNTETFYGGDHRGFTDYPFINGA